MKFNNASLLAATLASLLAPPARSQVTLEGRLRFPSYPGSSESIPLANVVVFASLPGSSSEALSFRTWEAEPAGWFRLSGTPGCYSVAFSTPAHFLRPQVLTNLYVRDGDKAKLSLEPAFELASFADKAWDPKPASRYFQLFKASGPSVTHVAFKLATDGLDGAGPGKRNFILQVRRKSAGTPDAWEPVGPAATVLDVDCGGPKSYWFSAGWCSGEVPTRPGEIHAIELRTEDPSGTFQAFWRANQDASQTCYRVAAGEKPESGALTGQTLWMSVASDGDGLVIPYAKRVHREFRELSRFGSKWAQTYVAQGRGIASVVLYAAVSGSQPPLTRQRARVRIRRGGPQGAVVGTEKIAVGSGNYTGDASWGMFGVVFAPGEAPVSPGEKYAIELESIESYATLHGFVNIKGEVSNDRPGFNPYKKCPPDDAPEGEAFYLGSEKVPYDLDLQVVEYAAQVDRWEEATQPESLLKNGDMQSGELDAKDPARGRPTAWSSFTVEAGAVGEYRLDEPSTTDRILRIADAKGGQSSVDGGFVQRVDGLSARETYVLAGQVRSSWPIDADRQCLFGLDPTGQSEDPAAPTILWTKLPALHGVEAPFRADPIRPRDASVSVWLRLRARQRPPEKFPFHADFDEITLKRVVTGVPVTTR